MDQLKAIDSGLMDPQRDSLVLLGDIRQSAAVGTNGHHQKHLMMDAQFSSTSSRFFSCNPEICLILASGPQPNPCPLPLSSLFCHGLPFQLKLLLPPSRKLGVVKGLVHTLLSSPPTHTPTQAVPPQKLPAKVTSSVLISNAKGVRWGVRGSFCPGHPGHQIPKPQ